MKTSTSLLMLTLVLSVSCFKHKSENSEPQRESQKLESVAVTPAPVATPLTVIEIPKIDQEALKAKRKNLDEKIAQLQKITNELDGFGVGFKADKREFNYTLLGTLRHKEQPKIFLNKLRNVMENEIKLINGILNEFDNVLDEKERIVFKSMLDNKKDFESLITDITENTNTFVDFCNGESIDEDSIVFAKDIFEDLKNGKYVFPKVQTCSDVPKWVEAVGLATMTFNEVQMGVKLRNPRLLVGLESLYGLVIYGDKKNLTDTNIIDLSVLENFSNLNRFETTRFNFTMNKVSHPLSVKKVVIIEGKFENPTFLKNFSFMEDLRIIYAGLKNLEPLSSVKFLKKLELGHNVIEDLTFVSHMSNLKELSFEYNYVQSLAPLSDLKNLDSLNISNNFVTDLTAIANLENLDYIKDFDTDIKICPKGSISPGVRRICN